MGKGLEGTGRHESSCAQGESRRLRSWWRILALTMHSADAQWAILHVRHWVRLRDELTYSLPTQGIPVTGKEAQA